MFHTRTGPSKGARRKTASQHSQGKNRSPSYENSSQHSQSSNQGEGSSSHRLPPTTISIEEFDNLVSDVIQCILVLDHHKHAIKQVDIKKNVKKLHSKNYKEVINRAKDVLEQTFGFRLVEVEPGTDRSYILVNKLAGSFRSTEEEEPKMVLLLLTLSYILICRGSVTDDKMWNFLSQLKIIQGNAKHSYFGDVRTLMTEELVKQLYLKYVPIPDTDAAKFEFRWGRRAEEEMDKNAVLRFIRTMYGSDDPSVWTAQHEEINQ